MLGCAFHLGFIQHYHGTGGFAAGDGGIQRAHDHLLVSFFFAMTEVHSLCGVKYFTSRLISI